MRKINASEAMIAFSGSQYTNLFHIHGSAIISMVTPGITLAEQMCYFQGGRYICMGRYTFVGIVTPESMWVLTIKGSLLISTYGMQPTMHAYTQNIL
jgi:hypothetical protein